MNKIFPAEAFEHSAIAYVQQVQVKSQVIYVVILLTAILALAAMPFIYVDVSVQSRGILQSSLERHVLHAPVGGRIIQYELEENRPVAAGALLLTIESDGITAQEATNSRRRQELQEYLHDLANMRSGKEAHTSQYVAAFQQYMARLKEADNRLQQAQADMNRNTPLFREKVIAPAEYEKIALEFNQAQSAFELVKKEQAARWEAEAMDLRKELEELQSRQVQLAEDRKKYSVAAPLNGALQDVTPLQPGSFVADNQQLAVIIPDSGLIALLHVPPHEIGMIRNGQQVKMRIDAFNYNEWGMVTGKVIAIAPDVTVTPDGQQSYFRVKCSLERQALQLKNGYKGALSKGMTLQASMIITRRNLYQLLYDKADDWFDPRRV